MLSKIGRSEPQLARAAEAIAEAGFELLPEQWPLRDGFQADLDAGRAGRETRNPFLREVAERMEEALMQPRPSRPAADKRSGGVTASSPACGRGPG